MQKVRQTIKNQWWVLVGVGIVFLYFASQKQGFHIDEVHSFVLSNQHGAPYVHKFSEWLSGQYYHRAMTVQPGERFDVVSVYMNQTKDVHPPLYYLIVNAVSSIFVQSSSKWLLLSINVGAIGLAMIAFRKISRLFIHDECKNQQMMWVWLMSTGLLSTAMYGRMYAVLVAEVLWMLYWVIKHAKAESLTKYHLIFLAMIVYMGLLTHYHFILIAFVISAGFSFLLWYQRRWRDFIKFSMTMFSTLVVGYITFPASYAHLFLSYRGVGAVVPEKNWHTAIAMIKLLNQQLFNGLGLIWIGLLLFATYRIVKNNSVKKVMPSIIIIVGSIILIGVLYYVVPYQTPRYFYAVFPLVWLGIGLYTGEVISNRVWRVLCVLQCVMLITVTKVDYLYPEQEVVYDAAKYKTNQAVVLSDVTFKVTELAPFLQEFDWVLPLRNVESGQELTTKISEHSSGGVMVFVSKALTEDTFISQIQTMTNMQQLEYIGDTNYFSVYYIN